MRLGGEIDHKIDVILAKQLVGQGSVADVSFDKDAPFAVYVVLDGAQIARISERVEHDYLDVLILIFIVKEILDEVGTDESSRASHEIGFHISCLFSVFSVYFGVVTIVFSSLPA